VPEGPPQPAPAGGRGADLPDDDYGTSLRKVTFFSRQISDSVTAWITGAVLNTMPADSAGCHRARQSRAESDRPPAVDFLGCCHMTLAHTA
jgi:hypothetical protein